MTWRVLDLFSGIGGFSLGLERAGMQTVAFCEIDPFCRRVLKKHWPGVPCHDDITTREFIEGEADIICGGFPCQDLSLCGDGAGLAGERSGLWRELLRAIRVVRPRYAIVENVAALLNRGMGVVLGDVATIGLDAEWHCIPGSHIGAPHDRDRLWIMAHPDQVGCASSPQQPAHDGAVLTPRISAASKLQIRGDVWDERILPALGLADGIPTDLGAVGGYGNSVIPQIPELIGKAVMSI